MKYNPSMLSHKVLEDLFVGSDRKRILQDIVDRARGAASSDERNHTLLVGRRGSGKSHLIALAYYRIGDLVTTESRSLQRSWLPEDPLTIHTYTEFLRQIAQGLQRASGLEKESFRDTKSTDVEAWLTRRSADAGTIVVFVENLDQILDTMGNLGQQRFRHYLQTTGSLLIVASTTTLSRDLTRQDSPFFGFFTTSNLAPFKLQTASEMLAAMAAVAGQPATADFVRTETGIARLKAIEHLAGGQPRMWATFGQALRPADLDELVNTLLTQFDELTPYYQEQLARLSPLQRRIVGTLAQADRPLTIDSIARELEDTSQTISKAVNLLHKSRGWLQPCDTKLTELIDGRRTYYELAEPLARIIFQFKESRGDPIRLVVEFIRLWFDPDQINAFSGSQNETIRPYFLRAAESDAAAAVARQLHGLPIPADVPRLDQLKDVDDALDALSHGDPEPLLELASAVRRATEDHLGDDPTDQQAIGNTRAFVHQAAYSAFENGRAALRNPANGASDVVHEWMNAALDIAGSTPVGIALTAMWACAARDFETAESAIRDCDRVLGRHHPATLAVRQNLASAYQEAGRTVDAIELQEMVLLDSEKAPESDIQDSFATRRNLAWFYRINGRTDEAIGLLEQVLADSQRTLGTDNPGTLIVRDHLALALRDEGNSRKALNVLQSVLADSERTLGVDHRDTLTRRINLAWTHSQAGNAKDAIELLEQGSEDAQRILGPNDTYGLTIRNNLAVAYFSAHRLGEAIAVQEQLLVDTEEMRGSDSPEALTNRNNLAAFYFGAERKDESINLVETVLVDAERLFGADHPAALASRDTLASMYTSTGRVGEAIELLEQVVAATQEVPKPDRADTLTVRNNLAGLYHSVGRINEAIELLEQVVVDSERTLGPDDPETLMARNLLAEWREEAPDTEQ